MRELTMARWIFAGVAATYVLSALMLAWFRSRGEAVAAWVIAGWLLTGIAGMVMAWQLTEKRPALWWGLLLALGPWMVYATIGDAAEKHWVMTALDVAGLIAIGWALRLAAGAALSSG